MKRSVIAVSLLLGVPFSMFSATGIQEIQNMQPVQGVDVAVVKVYSNACPHCNAFKLPFATMAANQQFKKFTFMAVDADKNPQFAHDTAIKSLPTTIIFKNGKEVTRIIGNEPDTLGNKLSEMAAQKQPRTR